MATETVESLPPTLEANAEQPPCLMELPGVYFLSLPFCTTCTCLVQGKVYPVNKVPSLEHNGKIIGESLDLIKYVDSNFEGPSLVPNDPDKKRTLEELLSYTDKFMEMLLLHLKETQKKKLVLLSITWRMLLKSMMMVHFS
ncbi:hypothetical protein ES332_1Z002400v1 [Gossypium tomentosum]|uniref:GST N-terminal domain-containing protein n=1 Tax=Gossypium tomentosum TaxID=34277 RepID=A0A5C7J1X7_GOSTO|nr:hypothetical protein ES332_1Z002400v1 [Gossypium tomentosum]